MSTPETWAKRFGAMAIINLLLTIGWALLPLLYDPNISRYIAGGSAGTWGYLGFLAMIIGGFTGFAALASLYYIIPKATGGNVNNILAWLNLVLGEVGIIGLSTLLGVAGYIGGQLIRAGRAAEVHAAIVWFTVEPFPGPVAIFLGLAGLGAFLGIVNLLLAFRSKKV
ncbi:MAG TPA: hypothetical protein VJ249_06190 [Candidatus Bathyarchaeia archaeon]|nr:hypothetical protein [Candidatus Bathyarchaeia archaeon]